MSKQFPPVALPHTEARRLTASLTGYEYLVYIALPAGYADTSQKYPAVYALDPHLIFGMTTEIIRLLEQGREMEPHILVGIGFLGSDRDIESYQVRDYVPTATANDTGSGGAENFLRFIREDLLPFINAEYRIEPENNGFLGHSLGGLFGFYTLFHQPDTFLRYIISSPWLDPDDLQVFSFETEYAATHSDLPAQVFLGAGSQEAGFVVSHIQKLQKTLEIRNYPNLRLQVNLFEGETHLSVVPHTIARGLKVLQDQA
jgi:predicted alpha/beta superfamily hydrolase